MKDQKITRAKLKELYNHFKSCNKWKDIIADTLIEETGSTILVKGTKLQEAYNEANSEQKKIIEKYFKIEVPKSIIDKVKDFNDILKISGKKLKDIIVFENSKNKKERFINACCKIQLITEVYNEGWIPNFNNGNEYKYYPFFYKKVSGWSFGGVSCCDTDSSLGFGFHYKTRELARDAGNKFLDIYIDYLPE